MKQIAPATYREKYAAGAGAVFQSAGRSSPGWQAVLADGEELLWQGRSAPVLRLSKRWPLRLLPGALLVGMGLLLFLADRWALDILATVLLGLGLLAMVPAELRHFIRQRRVFYSVSNKRAFKASSTLLGNRRLASWPITPATSFRLIKGDPSSIRFYEGRLETGRRPKYHAAFEALPDAADVHTLLLRIQKDAA